jgi:hypothetical protein
MSLTRGVKRNTVIKQKNDDVKQVKVVVEEQRKIGTSHVINGPIAIGKYQKVFQRL